MGNRHRAREIAVKLLYQHEASGESAETILEGFFVGHPINADTKASAESFVAGTIENLVEIDSLLCQASENWSLKRILPVDLSILRLAAFELLCVGAAPAIVIDEAVRLAKLYSSEKASSFINGVLDKIKEMSQNRTTRDPVVSGEQA